MPLLQSRHHVDAILLVEDHELTIATLTELLAKAFPSQSIHVARGAGEALRKVTQIEPEVIVMDIGLPDGPQPQPGTRWGE